MSEGYFHDHGITAGPKLPERSVMAGEPVDGSQLPRLRFEINVPDAEPCPHFMTGGTVIASDALIAVLRGIGVDNFQCFSARLVNPGTGRERTGYHLFNVLGVARLAGGAAGAGGGVGGPGGLHRVRPAAGPATRGVDETVRHAVMAHRA